MNKYIQTYLEVFQKNALYDGLAGPHTWNLSDAIRSAGRQVGERIQNRDQHLAILLGSALGAGTLGAAGFSNPGVDEHGKRKSRALSAIKGLLLGGGAGAVGGWGVGGLIGSNESSNIKDITKTVGGVLESFPQLPNPEANINDSQF